MPEPLLHSESFTMNGTASFIRTALPIAYRPVSFKIAGVETALLTEFVDPIDPTRWFWNPGDTIVFQGGVVAPIFGTVITITYESTSSNLVSAASTSTIDDLRNINDPQSSTVSPDTTYDYTPTQPSGIIQRVIDIPGVTNAPSAAAIASGIARRASVVPIAISGCTERPDLKVGQRRTFYLPEYNASGYYIISSLNGKADEADLGFNTCFRTSFEAVILQDAPDQDPADTSGGGTLTISSAYPIYQQQPISDLRTATAIQPNPLQFEPMSIVLGSGGALVGGIPLGNEYIVRHSGTLRAFWAKAATPPVNQSLVVDVFLNGVTIFGTHPIVIPSGSTTGQIIQQFRDSNLPLKVRYLDILTFGVVYLTGSGALTAAQNVTVEGEWYY